MATKKPKDLSHIHICTELHLPPELTAKAIAVALEERADNLVQPAMNGAPMMHMSQAMADIPQPVNARMAVIAKRLWKPGRLLRVRLLQKPSAHIADRIEHYAKVWSEHADLTFKLVTSGGGDIRVSFDPGSGSWSYIGTEAKLIGERKPTMNYGWLTDGTAEAEFSRVILHEFGHAIGAIHEHNHPDAGIRWNKPATYRYYMQSQGWSKADVDAQVFSAYARSQLNSGAYDRLSIMHYAIPAELLQAGATPVGWNTKLSARDKVFVASQYP
jgi:hypothetical protein